MLEKELEGKELVERADLDWLLAHSQPSNIGEGILFDMNVWNRKYEELREKYK